MVRREWYEGGHVGDTHPISFSDEKRRRIVQTAAAKGMTMAELVRTAVDEYLGDEIDAPIRGGMERSCCQWPAAVPARDQPSC